MPQTNQLTLHVALDMRCNDALLFGALRSVFSKTVQEMLSAALLDHIDSEWFISISLFYQNRIDNIFQQNVKANSPSLSQCFEALSRIPQMDQEAGVFQNVLSGGIKPFHSFLQKITDAPGAGGGHAQSALIASSYFNYSELFNSLTSISGRNSDVSVTCLVQDSEATCLTSALAGPQVRLHRCSLDPSDIRAVVQRTLGEYLGTHHSVRTILQLQTTHIACTAARTSITELNCCCTTRNFPQVAAQRPASVVLGDQLWRSGFELRRRQELILSLESILDPGDVDESYLWGTAWIITPDVQQPKAFSTFASFYALFEKDALLFKSTGSSALIPSHQLALPCEVFLGYFVDKHSLLLRQIIPTELRHTRSEANVPSRVTADPAALASLGAFREDLVHQRSTVSMEDLLKGGLCELVVQVQHNAAADGVLRIGR
ncbi:hypothetical protein, conserved [Angomonas deanei]|uniref:Uncharacterized protein n=1 Tax=Angomonas deanei TaxID=59799 RepID=A0A7G2CPD6_9TRYP|nr:hypothetical protein, conserved [Angomonas deanei]